MRLFTHIPNYLHTCLLTYQAAYTSDYLRTCLFSRLLMLQEQPHSARQQNGSVATAAYAYQHGKGKVVDRLAAKEENRHNGKQGGNRRIYRTGQSGENTVIDHLRNGFTPPMYLQVFPNPVKNNDGTVDGIPYYRQ